MADNLFFYCQVSSNKANSFISYAKKQGFEIKVFHRPKNLVDIVEIIFNDKEIFFNEFSKNLRDHLEFK